MKKIDSKTKNRISWWAIKARNTNDPFVRFVLYWFCFNAWITTLSGKDKDNKAIKWFIENDSDLMRAKVNFWGSSLTQAHLKELKNLGPVYDDRPGHHESKELIDINSVEQVVWFIYQIRCNLFHGSKDAMDTRHLGLVENSSIILEKWIKNALL